MLDRRADIGPGGVGMTMAFRSGAGAGRVLAGCRDTRAALGDLAVYDPIPLLAARSWSPGEAGKAGCYDWGETLEAPMHAAAGAGLAPMTRGSFRFVTRCARRLGVPRLTAVRVFLAGAGFRRMGGCRARRCQILAGVSGYDHDDDHNVPRRWAGHGLTTAAQTTFPLACSG